MGTYSVTKSGIGGRLARDFAGELRWKILIFLFTLLKKDLRKKWRYERAEVMIHILAEQI